MPKLHDACQIFAEEILDQLREFDQIEAPFVLALVYHAVEDDLSQHHHQATIIAVHLWQVLEETISRLHPEFEYFPAENSTLEEDDFRLGQLTQRALQLARSLFPASRAINFGT